MGFFSKTCAKTHLPITTVYKSQDFADVVALLPDGQVIMGIYDGYGNVGDENVAETPNGKWIWDKVKFVLAKHYAGETYNQLPRSGNELGQGYFMADAFLQYCKEHGPFKNRAAYVRAFKKYANWI